MAGIFDFKKLSDINLNDPIFDSLKRDYPGNENSTGFVEWFNKKAEQGEKALVFEDEYGLGAFILLKQYEDEPINLLDGQLDSKIRTKISTFKLSDRFRGKRLGEGAIGLILWIWSNKYNTDEIYVTVYEKQETLIILLEKFGFTYMGKNLNNECVYIKSKLNIDYTDPYKSFPFINPDMEKSGYIVINDEYHDTMFPYSELQNVFQKQLSLHVSNGLTKVYVGNSFKLPHYNIGEPILIYRRHQGENAKYKSCITSYCVVTDVTFAKQNGRIIISFENLWDDIKNKTVFTKDELRRIYNNKNVLIIKMIYYGYFGKGNNINLKYLKDNGYWPDGYPTETILNKKQFIEILKKGNINVSNIIID